MSVLNYDQAAEYLRINRRTLEKLVAACKIAHHRIGRRVVFRTADLDAYLERVRVDVD